MLVRSLPMKSTKSVARDVFDTFATHTGHIHDVTDTDCWAQHGGVYGRVFASFKRRSLTSRTDEKSSEKSLCVY